jgi:nickel-dependent lactate racemase
VDEVNGAGRDGAGRLLGEAEADAICAEAFARWKLEGRRVLLVIPDLTRTCPLDLLFRVIGRRLLGRVRALDVMVALGTHPPMPMDQIYRRVGITAEEHAAAYPGVRFFNHAWDDPDALMRLGEIPADEIRALTEGRFETGVEVRCNRAVADYDVVLIVGPVFPHEVVGMSGGNKYLFPGISGPEVLNFFHWLGAVITNREIIGRTWTPVRRVVDRAAQMVPAERRALCMVVQDGGLAGLYAGTPEEAWSAAADHSRRVHIVEKDRPFHTVLSCAPPMYDEIWVGAKCMYKLEPVVADGGTLIIYAPHIREVSVTHGRLIREIGYHTRDFFLAQWERYRHYPWGVLAHSTHVKGAGTFDGGVEKPRIEVVLATGIPEAECRAINLGYADPATIDPEDYRGREAEGVLLVPKAGETLYRLREPPAA